VACKVTELTNTAMGIENRDYYREQEPGISVRGPRSMVVILILINVAVYLANGLLTAENNTITKTLAVSSETLKNPLLWWQFLTYGFVHAASPHHVLFNMLQLWFLGRIVEQLYGRWEFLRVYLVMLVVGSVIWAIGNALFDPRPARLIGASGAVSGIVILFVLNFPQQTLMLFPIPIPIKAWVIGVLLVVFNVAGAIGEMGNTAFGVHLSGIVFAYLYHRNRWNLNWLGSGLLSPGRFKRRPKLRIHDPSSKESELSREVDQILEKIHRQGEESLTRKERRILETASREYQKRRGGD